MANTDFKNAVKICIHRCGNDIRKYAFLNSQLKLSVISYNRRLLSRSFSKEQHWRFLRRGKTNNTIKNPISSSRLTHLLRHRSAAGFSVVLTDQVCHDHDSWPELIALSEWTQSQLTWDLESRAGKSNGTKPFCFPDTWPLGPVT